MKFMKIEILNNYNIISLPAYTHTTKTHTHTTPMDFQLPQLRRELRVWEVKKWCQ